MPKPKVSVFLGISLDGCIAGPDGDLSWLSAVETSPPEDTGYDALMNDSDALVMGRTTYETVLSFETWPYADKRVIVLTHRTAAFSSLHGEEAWNTSLAAALISLEQDGHRHIYLDGGTVVRQALAAGLVDALTLNWVPVILGKGRALFAPDIPMSAWRLDSTQAFPSGLLQARYLPRR